VAWPAEMTARPLVSMPNASKGVGVVLKSDGDLKPHHWAGDVEAADDSTTRLPLDLGSSGEDVKEEVSGSSRAAPDTLPGPRMLIVDDSSMTRKMMVRSLGKEYPDIVEAEDGVGAVAMVKAVMNLGQTYDVILMDFQMPNMNGPSATKCIREMGYNGLVVGVTGNAMDSDQQIFKDAGADAVFTKPIKAPLLLQDIAKLRVQRYKTI